MEDGNFAISKVPDVLKTRNTDVDGLAVTKLSGLLDLDILVARIGECDAALFPEERDCVARAVGKRRAEFVAGRTLARIALREIGHAPCAIPQSGRSPVWPQGIVGSISHNNDYVATCVGREADFVGVGIDIEVARRVTVDLEARILTPEELADTTVPDARTLRFACKEAIYKAVNPINREFFGFQSVRIELDVRGGTFRAEPVKGGSFAGYVASGQGVFIEWQGNYLAGFYVAR